MFSTILIFLAILAVLVLAHEAGHFWVARRNGVRVDEFGFGFPPRLVSWKKGQTRYSINLIPLGGFVKIHGEQGEGRGDSDSFASKPAGKRAKIIVAGVLMNFILAIVLMSFGNIIGMPGVVAEAESGAKIRDEKIQITGVLADSPAEKAGFQAGDILVGFKNENEFQGFIKQNEGQNIEIKVARGKEILNLQVVPKISQDSQGPVIGVSIAKTGIISYPVWQSFIKGIVDTINLIFLIVQIAGKLIYQAFLGESVMNVLAGPVGIYKITAQAAGMGFSYILNLIILLSIQLGIINILPFPALDGGRLLFLAIEKIKGKPVSQKVENIIHTIGFALLMLLMAVITWRDIIRFF